MKELAAMSLGEFQYQFTGDVNYSSDDEECVKEAQERLDFYKQNHQ